MCGKAQEAQSDQTGGKDNNRDASNLAKVGQIPTVHCVHADREKGADESHFRESTGKPARLDVDEETRAVSLRMPAWAEGKTRTEEEGNGTW